MTKSKEQMKGELINMRMRQKKITDDFTSQVVNKHEQLLQQKEKEFDEKFREGFSHDECKRI